MLVGGLATAGVLGGLAGGLSSSGVGQAIETAKSAALGGQASHAEIEEAWADHERAVQLGRTLGAAAGVSAGVGVLVFSVGFGLSKSRKTTLLAPWEPWARKEQQ
jgi:hypothetical protein